MAWLQLEGHDDVVAHFRAALAQERLASTFLFVGPEGIGKRSFAMRLAQALLCETRDERLLDPCGHCPACVQVLAGTNPDFLFVSRPPGKSFIPLGLLKGDEPDWPVHNSLLFNLALRPFRGRRKVAVIDDADYLNQEGANCLLKTLEEPPPHSVLILISTSADRQLPTIRSRAQLIRFQPLPESLVARLLVERGVATDADQARHLAAFSGGSLSRAAELSDPQLWTFRAALLQNLAESPFPSTALGQSLLKFVDEAGKEAPLRRVRLRWAIGFAAEFFRQLVHAFAGLPPEGDAELTKNVQRAVQSATWNLESGADAAQRSLEALNHVDRNANQHTLVEAWLDDLLVLSRHGAPRPELAAKSRR
ncbi:MAG TPA: DNA polymerase III subunit [Pirellulales bacterium]|jgi:DNA polymerase-3 subunit delta'|nr:DNA polymerase III subunit [Pirellulales bacterium]